MKFDWIQQGKANSTDGPADVKPVNEAQSPSTRPVNETPSTKAPNETQGPSTEPLNGAPTPSTTEQKGTDGVEVQE